MVQAEARSGLNSLRLGVTRKSPPRLVCTWMEGNEQRWKQVVRLDRLGLWLDRTNWERYSGSEASLASSFYLASEVGRQLMPDLESGRPLWLTFQDGWLACLPWERWLQPNHPGPVLRLPYLDFEPPSRPRGRLEVLICSSTPAAKPTFPVPELLAKTIKEVADDQPATFHIFVDHTHYLAVERRLANYVAEGRAVVYHPMSAARYGQAPPIRNVEDAFAVESPWLRWMLNSVPSRHVDFAIFLCHGYRSEGIGALAFAESPLRGADPLWARFVGPRQLTTFLDHVGASVLALVSPPGNFSVSGMWALADDIAHHRPGPVIAIDTWSDPENATLGRAMSFLAGPENQQPPASRAITLYCHPRQVASTHMLPYSSSLRGLSPGPENRAATAKHGLEPWTNAGQLILERHLAQYAALVEVKTSIAAATRSGQEEALRYVASLLGNASTSRSPEGKG